MAAVNTKFSVAKNAFHFVNRFEFNFPVKFKLPLGGEVDLSKTVLGLCGGMCFSALDHFYSGEPLPEAVRPDAIDPATLAYLCDRQLDSLSIPVVLKIIEWMLIDRAELARRMARYEIPRLRRQLERGDPVVLALIRVSGAADPTHNHQVIATGCDYDPGTRDLSLTLYDPNHPGETPTIRLNLAAPRHGFDLAQSTAEPLRAFFVIPYQRQAPRMRMAPRAGLVPRGALPFHLQWPVDSRRVNQFFGENPDNYRPFGLAGHEGLDLFAMTGANIYAAAAGEVTQASHPPNHPYGLHVRIRHEAGGKVFHTIYAHLTQALVKEKDQVGAGTLIGLADNTGNSFGSHLHLTLKIEGEQTPGYPAGVVDPWPYLKDQEDNPPSTPERPLPAASGLIVYTAGELNLRAGPSTESQVVAALPAGEALSVLGELAQVKPKIGIQDEWLQVRTASGQAGFVAAWFVQPEGLPFPPSDLVVYPYDALNLRSGPGAGFDILAELTFGEPLTVLGDAGLARSRLGQQSAWLQVETRAGLHGFVAAWLVHATGQSAPATGLVVFPTVMLNVRARPDTEANILTVALPGDSLALLGDKEAAAAHIGKQDQWLNVRTPQGLNGFVAAWLVAVSEPVQPGFNPAPPGPALTSLTVFAADEVNLRAQPSLNSPRVGGANLNEALKVIEADLSAARAKIGRQDAWVFIQRQDGTRGWVAAWLLSAQPV